MKIFYSILKINDEQPLIIRSLTTQNVNNVYKKSNAYQLD